VLQQVGWAGALLYNETSGRIIDGHLRREVAQDGKVPVLIGSWTEEQEALILATLDPLAAMAEADADKVRALLEGLGEQDAAVQAVLDGLAADAGIVAEVATVDAEAQTDEAEELQEHWKVKAGDIWRMGDHAVICGDCREPETWRRLLVAAEVEKPDLLLTDPPYGIKRDEGFEGFEGFGGFGPPIARRQYSDSWDDARPAKSTFDYIVQMAERAIIFGGNFFADILPCSTHWIVWDKLQTMPTFGDCELLWTNLERKSVRKIAFEYNGLIGKEAERYHPTQKPLGLLAQIVTEYSKSGDCIVDPFLGSGTTIMAANQNGRRGLGIEALEKYVSVCLQRFLQATGIEPQLIEHE